MSKDELRSRKNLLRWARRRAQNQGLPFELELEHISIPSHCPLLGVPLKPGTGPNSPSLDRFDPKLGYVPTNVWVISVAANTAKHNLSPPQLLTLAINLAFYSKGPKNGV